MIISIKSRERKTKLNIKKTFGGRATPDRPKELVRGVSPNFTEALTRLNATQNELTELIE